MKLHVWPTKDAEADVRELGEWWRENRRAAKDAFKNELSRVLGVLADTPNIGEPYVADIPGVRRMRLRRTPYHVYYIPRIEQADVVVIAVWSAQRGEGPPLRRP